MGNCVTHRSRVMKNGANFTFSSQASETPKLNLILVKNYGKYYTMQMEEDDDEKESHGNHDHYHGMNNMG